MADSKRHPHADNDVIELSDDERTPSQGGSSGGDMQREIGAIDEERTAPKGAEGGADPQPTSVHKGMKPRQGDEPNLPNRQQTGEGQDKAPPKRTN